MPFERAEDELITAIHLLEDKAQALREQGTVGDLSIWQKIADGKAALFVLQEVIRKYQHPDDRFRIDRNDTAA